MRKQDWTLRNPSKKQLAWAKWIMTDCSYFPSSVVAAAAAAAVE
jgi:hypothetical protein